MIKLKNLSFTYEGSKSEKGQLYNINLTVQKGELIILAGRSGCGKTTLTRIVNGLCPNFYPGTISGEYLLNDEDALKIPIHQLGTMIGSVFQDPRSQFFATNTTDEIVLGMENVPYQREKMKSAFDDLKSQMQLEPLVNRKIFPLSSGEKQQVAIASACAVEPKIIVMDEPSANLDSEAISRLSVLLLRLKQKGHTIILSEHRFHFVKDFFDKMIYLDNGEIVETFDRETALALSDDELNSMGMRNFNVPKLAVGGAFTQKAEHALQVSGISYLKDTKVILDAVSFTVDKGKVLSIAGPNGAGKSSLCRAVTGLYKGMGTVQFDDEFLKRKNRIRRSFFVQQDTDYQLYAPTVLDEFFIGNKETPKRKDEALKWIEKVGLTKHINRHSASLSGGEKQRLLLALAAASGKKLLLFDEPTSGLDGYNMRLTVDLLRELADKGNCVILITHDMDLMCTVSDSVLYLDKSEVIYHRNIIRGVSLNDE